MLFQIGGVVHVTRADNELDVTEYVLFWAAPTTFLDQDPEFIPFENSMILIGAVAAFPANSGDASERNVSFVIPESTQIPPRMTHLAVFVRNPQGYSRFGASVVIVDFVLIANPIPLSHSVQVTPLAIPALLFFCFCCWARRHV